MTSSNILSFPFSFRLSPCIEHSPAMLHRIRTPDPVSITKSSPQRIEGFLEKNVTGKSESIFWPTRDRGSRSVFIEGLSSTRHDVTKTVRLEIDITLDQKAKISTRPQFRQ